MLVLGDLQYHCVHVSTDLGTSVIYNSPRIIRKYLKAQKFKTKNEGDLSDEFIDDEIVDDDE
jgi:hypothetical protein